MLLEKMIEFKTRLDIAKEDIKIQWNKKYGEHNLDIPSMDADYITNRKIYCLGDAIEKLEEIIFKWRQIEKMEADMDKNIE